MNKDTLVAYTIAVIQNIQALKFDQMQVALQTVQNESSIETPLIVQSLMTVHFNLAILMNDIPPQTDAQEPEGTTVDARPSTSASEETACKTTHHNSKRKAQTPKPTTQPTRAVSPTRRDDGYGPVCGIPAGYESDDTWDGTSDFGEHPCETTNDISTFVAYRWPRHPRRGCRRAHEQSNNIVVHGANTPHSWPWDAQPYGRHTHS